MLSQEFLIWDSLRNYETMPTDLGKVGKTFFFFLTLYFKVVQEPDWLLGPEGSLSHQHQNSYMAPFKLLLLKFKLL